MLKVGRSAIGLVILMSQDLDTGNGEGDWKHDFLPKKSGIRRFEPSTLH